MKSLWRKKPAKSPDMFRGYRISRALPEQADSSSIIENLKEVRL